MSNIRNRHRRTTLTARTRMPVSRPSLRFTPLAWAKLLYLRDRGPTEVGGFGISDPADLLLVTDVTLIRQVSSAVSVSFEDQAVADFFDEQIDTGRLPSSFGRIWIHTHPGESPYPSVVDEETFARVFGRCDWSVMAILAREGQTYARLQFSTGPGGSLNLPMRVDYQVPFAGSDNAAWNGEYLSAVTPGQPQFLDDYDCLVTELHAGRNRADSKNAPRTPC